MSKPEVSQIIYDFSAAPEPVLLLKGTAEMSICGEKFTEESRLYMRFSPKPGLFFRFGSQVNELAAFKVELCDTSYCSFFFNGKMIDGSYANKKMLDSSFELDWLPRSQPQELGEKMQQKTSCAAVFHLFNFLDFETQHRDPESGYDFILLESDEWIIEILRLPKEQTKEAWKKIRETEGAFLTHTVRLKRKNGSAFSGEDAKEQKLLLEIFLAFVSGGRCSLVCGVGFAVDGQKTWQTVDSPLVRKAILYWFTQDSRQDKNQAELLFPLFAKRWNQSKEWQDCLHTIIYWYVQANTAGDGVGIDAALILAQAGLERLAHHYLVVDRKMVSDKGFNDLRASDRLRMLFTTCGIPNEITKAIPDICDTSATFSKNKKWLDAPHALTDIRNELVHPVSKKNVVDCHTDAWKLSLWYLELSILATCGYEGSYTNRITAKYATHSEPVPWVNKA